MTGPSSSHLKEQGTGISDDPNLTIDVSKYLQDLNVDVNGAQEPATQKRSKSLAKPKPKKATNASPHSKTPPDPPPKRKNTANATEPPPKPASADTVKLPTFNPKSPFMFTPTALWHTAIPPLPPSSAPTASQLSSLTEKASILHQNDIRTFQNSSSSSSSESSFLAKIIQSGTLSDRLSALTLLVQSSPLHNTKALDTLKCMAERGKAKGGREEGLKALRCVVDWWVGGGAPARKLKYFRDQPLTHSGVTDQHLLAWYFEDWLKKYFFSILQMLEVFSLDPLPYIRTQSLNLIFILLRDKPEQEQNLLCLLVNKLGDTEKSLCSRASYHLLQLLQSHPSMKSVVIREVTALVLRPATPTTTVMTPADVPKAKHIRFTDDDDSSKLKPKKKAAADVKKLAPVGNTHARYYSTITFNQIVLAPGDRDVALKLIDVYFEMFKEILGEGGVDDVDDGAENDKDGRTEILKDKKGRVVDRGGKKGKGKKGKGKEREVTGAAGFAEVEDSNSRLVSAILTGVNRALPFAKVDAGDVGLNKHIDTLFLITHTSTFNISLQALVLIQQISSSLSGSQGRPSQSQSQSQSTLAKLITDRYYRTLYASLHDTRLATSSKQAMYLNLLFKSLKADVGGDGGVERIAAVVRRFVQVLLSGGGGATEFVAGGLYLLGELFSTVPGLRALLNDAPLGGKTEAYDPKKRDPKYAHASASPLWELTPLLHHYHPAIVLHARQLLLSQPLTASADLSQNTLSHFLDRFVYKNPKKVKGGGGDEDENGVLGKTKGGSAMQPAASGYEGGGVKLRKGEVREVGGVRMNDESFLRKRAEDVPVDQLFYHRYFTRKNEREKAKKKDGKMKGQESDDESGEEEGEEKEEERSDGGEEDEDEEASELDEDEVWKAMKASMPKTAGDDDGVLLQDGSDDDLPSDFDIDDGDEDGEDMGDDEDDDEGDEGSENGNAGEDQDGDGLSLAEGSDNEDLIPLDDDVPEGLVEWDGSDAVQKEEEEEWGGIDDGVTKKRKRREGPSTGVKEKQRRKKLRSLPTFASYDEYAKMIEEGPEDDI